MASTSSTKNLVSVCIPVFNGGKYLAETIESILNQSYQDIEIIVQDNMSQDNTWPLLENLAAANPNIFIHRNEQTCCMAANWNLAINRATGKYIVLLSADDLLEPLFVEKCVELLTQGLADAVTTNHFLLKGSIKTHRKVMMAPGLYEKYSDHVLKLNPFSINFTMFTSELVYRMRVRGGLFGRLFYTCDFDLWIRMALKNERLFYLEDCLGIYRVHDNNLSLQKRRMTRQAALVVLSHKKALKIKHPFSYRLFLLKLIIKGFRANFFHREKDSRLLMVSIQEMFTEARSVANPGIKSKESIKGLEKCK